MKLTTRQRGCLLYLIWRQSYGVSAGVHVSYVSIFLLPEGWVKDDWCRRDCSSELDRWSLAVHDMFNVPQIAGWLRSIKPLRLAVDMINAFSWTKHNCRVVSLFAGDSGDFDFNLKFVVERLQHLHRSSTEWRRITCLGKHPADVANLKYLYRLQDGCYLSIHVIIILHNTHDKVCSWNGIITCWQYVRYKRRVRQPLSEKESVAVHMPWRIVW